MENLVQTRRHGEQGLAGAGLADDRDHLDGIVQQRVHRKVLLFVARLDLAQLLRDADQRHQRPRLAVVAREHAAGLVGFVADQQVLVCVEQRVLDRELAALPDRLERSGRQGLLARSGIQLVQIHAVGLIVLGLQPDRVGLEAQVDVLADHEARLVRCGALDLHRHPQDLVIGGAGGVQGVVRAREGDAQQSAALQRDADGQMAFQAHVVERPGHLARVAAQLGHVALEGIDLLDDLQRYDHIVFLEVAESRRVVKQHIRIEYVCFFHRNQIYQPLPRLPQKNHVTAGRQAR